MNYIYDIVLNFQKNCYDFYEWNKNDNIYHMRKIAVVKISSIDLYNIKTNKIIFDNTSLELLKNKKIIAERFNQNNISKIKNTLILADNKEAIAIRINKDGQIYQQSTLLPDEKEDVLGIIKFQKETKINYKIIEKNIPLTFKTRFELENDSFINNELDKIYKEKNIQKLNYLYLECFNQKETNPKIAYNKLKAEIKKSNENFKKLYNIFKIINKQSQSKL